jgi:pimeloyl-ACP methyl ester carboxylesterase
MIRSSRAIVALWLLLWTSPAIAAGLPVLFIHGFCSSADTWEDTLPQLSTERYGYDAPRIYENTNGKAAARTLVQAGSRTFRIDFSDLKGGFDLLAVANVPTNRKAGELKVVIDAIKQFTGAPAVILVGHSLGGLAARSYMQGTGHDRNGIPISYGRDVAALVVSGFPEQDECILADTANLRELQPASGFLRELNRRAWPVLAGVHSIISSNAGTDSDDVVNTTSQDLTALETYASLPEAKRWVQTFERNGVLHLRVHNEAVTVSLFTGIISDLDGK